MYYKCNVDSLFHEEVHTVLLSSSSFVYYSIIIFSIIIFSIILLFLFDYTIILLLYYSIIAIRSPCHCCSIMRVCVSVCVCVCVCLCVYLCFLYVFSIRVPVCVYGSITFLLRVYCCSIFIISLHCSVHFLSHYLFVSIYGSITVQYYLITLFLVSDFLLYYSSSAIR